MPRTYQYAIMVWSTDYNNTRPKTWTNRIWIALPGEVWKILAEVTYEDTPDVDFGPTDVPASLNRLGLEGWQLVSTQHTAMTMLTPSQGWPQGTSSPTSTSFYLMREVDS
jgi:hypothetical protein